MATKTKTIKSKSEPFDARWERTKQELDDLVAEYNQKNKKQIEQSRAEMNRFFRERNKLVKQFNETVDILYRRLLELLPKEQRKFLSAIHTILYIKHDVRNARREDLRHYRILLRDYQILLNSKKVRAPRRKSGGLK